MSLSEQKTVAALSAMTSENHLDTFSIQLHIQGFGNRRDPYNLAQNVWALLRHKTLN